MNRILDYWEERLRNWAYWTLSGGRLCISTAYDGVFGEGAPRQPIALVGEALDTDDLIAKLTTEQHQAIKAVYLWTVPETLEARARELGIHRDTLADRIRAAKLRLDALHLARRWGDPIHTSITDHVVSAKCDTTA